jgi:hypothetical protein
MGILVYELYILTPSRKARKGNLLIKSGFESFNALTSLREKILGLFLQAVANSHPYILPSPKSVKYFIKSFNKLNVFSE